MEWGAFRQPSWENDDKPGALQDPGLRQRGIELEVFPSTKKHREPTSWHFMTRRYVDARYHYITLIWSQCQWVSSPAFFRLWVSSNLHHRWIPTMEMCHKTTCLQPSLRIHVWSQATSQSGVLQTVWYMCAVFSTCYIICYKMLQPWNSDKRHYGQQVGLRQPPGRTFTMFTRVDWQPGPFREDGDHPTDGFFTPKHWFPETVSPLKRTNNVWRPM